MVLQRTIAFRHMNHKGEFGGKRHRMVEHIQLTNLCGWNNDIVNLTDITYDDTAKKNSKSLKGPIFVDNCVRDFVLRKLEIRK